MADKMTVMRKWLDDIEADENVTLTDNDRAYIAYAILRYGLYGEKTNIGEVFGKEHSTLNLAMPNIYGQIDNIQNYNPNRSAKYDPEEIKRLRLEGYTSPQICDVLGIPRSKAKSITTNKGWKDAGEILKKNNGGNIEGITPVTEKTDLSNHVSFDF